LDEAVARQVLAIFSASSCSSLSFLDFHLRISRFDLAAIARFCPFFCFVFSHLLDLLFVLFFIWQTPENSETRLRLCLLFGGEVGS
jgi:hypothetical protein